MSKACLIGGLAISGFLLIGNAGAEAPPARKGDGLTKQLAASAIQKIAEDPKIIGRFLEKFDDGLPNRITRTKGGHTWWKNLETHRGWKLQQNIVFGNCRILDSRDYRYAWGGREAMTKTFARMKRNGMVIYNPQGVPEVRLGKWTDVAIARKWKMQKNASSLHGRLVDDTGRTVAIGPLKDLEDFFKRLTDSK